MGQRAVGRKKRYKKDNNVYCAKLFKGTCMWKCGDTDYLWGHNRKSERPRENIY